MIKHGKKILAALLCAGAVGLGLAACGGGTVSAKFVTYDGNVITLSGKSGAAIEFPDVKRDGYALDGWYASEDLSGEPMTDAKYSKGLTFYAKWSPVYEVVFDLDGGGFSSDMELPLALRAGENIYERVQYYVPTKGELNFGGWFVGDDELSQTSVMTQRGVTLTAKYKAQYTVNAHLQNENLDTDYSTYTPNAGYATGYEFVGEELTVPEVPGFTLSDGDLDKLPFEISEDKTENEFDLHYDRSAYNVVFDSNYPEGAGNSESKAQTYYYNVKFTLPTDMYDLDGYRFVGWSEKANATANDVIRDAEYSVTKGVTLYAVWNKGYTDMFGGNDLIFVSPFGDGKATLCRGGVDIAGTYDERRDVYTFSGDNGYLLRAKLSDAGTFVYYSERHGSSYYLFKNGAADENYTLSLDQTNVVQYYSTADGDRFEKTGTYSINDQGIYVAEFEDGTTFEFLLGTSQTDGRAVFRIRGDEYKFGAMGRFGTNYPVIVLDGFGNAMYIANSTAKEAYYSYTISRDGDKSIVTVSSASSRMVVRVFEYGERYGYESYVAALDNVYTDGEKTLSVDGCSNAVYTDGATTVSSIFSYENSVFGGYLISIAASNRRYLFRAYDVANGDDEVSHRLEVLDNGYVEYRYLSPSGRVSDEPYLVVYGDGTAALYEMHEEALSLVSSGTFVKEGDSYLYTVTGDIAEWSENKYTALVVNLDTNSTSYNIYYRLSATDESGDTDYTVTYNEASGSGATLTVAASFAFYTAADGSKKSGVYNDRTTYVVMAGTPNNYYFALDKDALTFEVLTRAPVVLTRRNPSGSVSLTNTLTVTGRTAASGGAEAIHAVTTGGTPVITHGTFSAVDASGLGVNASVCTFVADDGSETFKFLITVQNGNSYFVYYESTDVVELANYTEANERGDEVENSSLVLTDRISNGKNIAVYNHGGESVDGLTSSRELVVFDSYRFNIYTFTSLDEQTTFEFTIVNGYFRRCAEDETFTSKDGTLVLNGAAHVARYVNGDGVVVDNGYLVLTSILDDNDRAVMMVIGGEPVYFDLDTEARSFAVRGVEANSYIVLENTMPVGRTLTLDGHGGATVTQGDDTVRGTYVIDGDRCTVTVGTETLAGSFGVITVGNTQYNAFSLAMPGIAGSYINKADLSVIVLDDVGGAVKYGTRGVADRGTYVRIDDGVFYYINSDATDAAMYTVTASGEVTGADYSATYYADDFSSIVLFRSGALVINNAETMYFRYDKSSDKIFTYVSAEEGANEYGFKSTELSIIDNAITYNGVVYKYFDGKYVEFTDASGNKLEFMPTGDPEFTVNGTYTAAGGTSGETYSVSVVYDENGKAHTSMASVRKTRLAGSYNEYNMYVGYELDIHFADKTFTLDRTNASVGMTAYDYQYMLVLATYDVTTMPGSFYADRYFGQLNIYGETAEDGSIEYRLSGQMNAIAPVGRRTVQFENGTLSAAGYMNSNYGNMFTAEFTGDDNNMYHLNFFLVPTNIDGLCTYIVYSCTRVSGRTELSDGSVIYSERFVYTTGFEIPKGDGTYYTVGDAYLPTLKYKGEIICSADFEDVGNNTWRFMSRRFAGNRYADYYYYYTYTVGDDETVTPVSVVRRFAYTCEAGGENTVRVVTGSTSSVSEIYEVLAMHYEDKTVYFETCVKNGDGDFTVTTEDGTTYNITFTENTAGEQTTVTATITPVA